VLPGPGPSHMFLRCPTMSRHGRADSHSDYSGRPRRLVRNPLRPRQGKAQEIPGLGRFVRGVLPARRHGRGPGGSQLPPGGHRRSVRPHAGPRRHGDVQGQGGLYRRPRRRRDVRRGQGPMRAQPRPVPLGQGRRPRGERREAARRYHVQEPPDRHPRGRRPRLRCRRCGAGRLRRDRGDGPRRARVQEAEPQDPQDAEGLRQHLHRQEGAKSFQASMGITSIPGSS